MFVSARGREGRLLEGCAVTVYSASETGIFFYIFFFFFREWQGNGEDFEGEMSERIKTNQGRKEEESIEMKDEHHRLELFCFFFPRGTTKKRKRKTPIKPLAPSRIGK